MLIDLIPWGIQQGVIMKEDYTLLVIAVATGHNEKEVQYVLLELHKQRG